MKEPNFFLIGAPKCGTTTLARWLADHPSIFMSPIKEPHFYSTDLANRSVNSAQSYRALFRKAGSEHLAVGEASTWYLFSKQAVPAIEREHPGSKYIVMTRDPADMARSLYDHNLRVLHEDQPTFEQAWIAQADRARGLQIPRTCIEPAFLQYFEACRLGTLLERLSEIVPAERILHIDLEIMKIDPRLVYERVLTFLSVPDDRRTSFPIANPARRHRSRLFQRGLRIGSIVKRRLGFTSPTGLARLNEKPIVKAPLSPDFERMIQQAFAEEKDSLSRVMKRLARRIPPQ